MCAGQQEVKSDKTQAETPKQVKVRVLEPPSPLKQQKPTVGKK
jgi:hypothetical protein